MYGISIMSADGGAGFREWQFRNYQDSLYDGDDNNDPTDDDSDNDWDD